MFKNKTMGKTSKEIQAGDIVVLPSSPGLEMTVGAIDATLANKYCTCLWFDLNLTLHERRFPVNALKKAVKKVSGIGGQQMG